MNHDSPDKPDDELALWRDSVADVQRLSLRRRAPKAAPPKDLDARRRAETEEVLNEAMHGEIAPEDFETGDQSQFRRDGVAPATLRKLRRGQFAIQASLDLHGLTRARAQTELAAFLRHALNRDWRCVRIIHGKGLRSPQGRPVLKARVEISLQRHEQVLAYASAPNWAGGHGAGLVLLRRAAPR